MDIKNNNCTTGNCYYENQKIKQLEEAPQVSINFIQNILGELAVEKISLQKIVSAVAKHFDIQEKKLYGKSRVMDVAQARHVAMFLSRELTKNSLILIGKHFGKRDHSTVIHACKTVEDKMNSDVVLKKNINILLAELK